MSANLESFVNNVQTLSQQGKFSQLVTLATKSVDGLSRTQALLDTALATLNVQEHSIGVLAILIAKYSIPSAILAPSAILPPSAISVSEEFESLFVSTQQFVESCNGEQVRYAGELFVELCEFVTSVLTEKNMAIRGIRLVLKALQKLQLHASELTPLHAHLCQLCLTSKCLKPALAVLDVDITTISKKCGSNDVRSFLLYYYYGGLIYAANKHFKRASFFFEIVVTTPSLALSHIMLEAYKKYILTSLIQYGKVLPLPRYTSHMVPRYIKSLCQAYLELSHSFTQSEPNHLQQVANKHLDTFTTDGNMGLVKQCIKAHYKRKIQSLTKTFLTMSFENVARRVHLETAMVAHQYVLHMIEDGEICASINERDNMVSFNDNSQHYNNSQVTLEDQILEVMWLEKRLKGMDKDILLSPLYVQKMAGVCDEDGPVGSGVKLAM